MSYLCPGVPDGGLQCSLDIGNTQLRDGVEVMVKVGLFVGVIVITIVVGVSVAGTLVLGAGVSGGHPFDGNPKIQRFSLGVGVAVGVSAGTLVFN